MKELNFICVQPDDTYYTWQVNLWLESLKTLGYSDRAIVLIFIPTFREQNPKWKQIIDLYPEAKFYFYKDNGTASNLLHIYIPIIRPYVLARFFEDHPDMTNKAIFYCDSDVIFMPDFNVSQYIDDDVCYVSDTNSYINASYFDSKVKDVLPDKLEEYKKLDVLDELGKLIGINRNIAEKNNLHSGGAQYLLKNIDGRFWAKVMSDCITIRTHLMDVNKTYFESESKGFQSWCADMWAVLWGLWAKGQEVKVIEEMNFSWAPDPIEKLKTHKIYHNAGISGDKMEYGKDENGNKLFYPCFYKGKYVSGMSPMNDLDRVLYHEESKKHCTWWYANKLDELRMKYNLTY
jgi:hypothetical protein